MSSVRVLFVDDEPNIRLTLPEILRMHGFQVTATATVSEALKAIQEDEFDVLIADLNIGQPGDGFTVVSAMRRTQPDAVTLILTGYPAFETALQAIRSQVDDYAVKPADVNELIALIREKLEDRKPHRPLASKPLSVILRENQSHIVQDWIGLVKAEPDLATVDLEDGERSQFLLRVLGDVVLCLQRASAAFRPGPREAASQCGRERRAQGYSALMLLKEASLVRHVILTTVQNHLLVLDMSSVFTDLVAVDDCLDVHTRYMLEAFLAEDTIAA